MEIQFWETKSRNKAIKMADDIVGLFNEALRECQPLLPTNSPNERIELFNVFMDGLIGATVMIGATYTTDTSLGFEDAVVRNIKHKFGELRKANLGGQREMGKAPIN